MPGLPSCTAPDRRYPPPDPPRRSNDPPGPPLQAGFSFCARSRWARLGVDAPRTGNHKPDCRAASGSPANSQLLSSCRGARRQPSGGRTMLVFDCPVTKNHVRTSVNTSPEELKRLGGFRLSLWCPHCRPATRSWQPMRVSSMTRQASLRPTSPLRRYRPSGFHGPRLARATNKAEMISPGRRTRGLK